MSRISKLPEINLDFTLREPEAWRLGLLIADKGARLAGIMVSLPDTHAIQSFLREADNLGIRIVRIEADLNAPGGPKMLVVARGKNDPEKLLASLTEAASRAGLKVLATIGEQSPGLWINTAVFPLYAGSERIIGLRTGSLARMTADLRSRIGPGSLVLYYYAGKLYGEESAHLYLDVLGARDPETCLKAFLAGMQALGRARPLKVRFENGRYIIVLEDAWDAREIECSQTRGMLAGFMSVILGEELRSEARVEDRLCFISLEAQGAKRRIAGKQPG